MLTVKKYEANDLETVVAFIRKVQENAVPCEKILARSVLIKDDAHIVGMVSYESHDFMGIIRYFLYDARLAGVDLLVNMFLSLYKNAREEGLKQLVAQIPNETVGHLFKTLGFETVSPKNEGALGGADFGNTVMMLNLMN